MNLTHIYFIPRVGVGLKNSDAEISQTHLSGHLTKRRCLKTAGGGEPARCFEGSRDSDSLPHFGYRDAGDGLLLFTSTPPAQGLGGWN